MATNNTKKARVAARKRHRPVLLGTLAEQLTLLLAKGPVKDDQVLAHFSRRHGPPWADIEAVADRCGIVRGPFWRLPEGHPMRAEIENP